MIAVADRREEFFAYGRSSDRRDARNRYRYIGVERDEDTGLCMTGPRTYDPVVGRFHQRDPVVGGAPFVYSRGNPIARMDGNGYADTAPILLQLSSDQAVPEPQPPPPNSNEALAARGLMPAPPELLVVAFNGGSSGAFGSLSADRGGGASQFVEHVVLPEARYRGTSVEVGLVSPGLSDSAPVMGAVSFVKEHAGPNTHVVLFGYSRGADPAVQTARTLGEEGIGVDRLYLIDPTEGPLGLLGREDMISKNVSAAYVAFQGSDPLLNGASSTKALHVESALTKLTKEDFSSYFSPLPLWGHGGVHEYAVPSLQNDLSMAAASWFNPSEPVPTPLGERFPVASDGSYFAP